MNWPFDQEPSVAGVTCKSVMAGTPVLVAVHYLDDHSWAFLDGQAWDPDQALVVSMKSILDLHPYLRDIADLPAGWSASRTGDGASWIREIDPADEAE